MAMNAGKAAGGINGFKRIFRTLAHRNSIALCLLNRLAVIRKPLVTKNTSTAMEPNVTPRATRSGWASLEPLVNTKL